jgi:trimeric autotransporter adhesin
METLAKKLLALVATITICGMLSPTHVMSIPVEPSVENGLADISQVGNSMVVDQHTDKAIINWDEYSIADNELVQYMQPGADSIALNKITGANPSEIMGSLVANGQIFIINPNGILFGPDSHVNTAGLLATTLNISDADFLEGNYEFSQDQYKELASIINKGEIVIADNGYAVIVAPLVSDEGLIVANLGTVHVGAAEHFTVSFDGRNLINFEITTPPENSVPGTVLIPTENVSEIIRQVVNCEDIFEEEGMTSLVAASGTMIHNGTITSTEGPVNVAFTAEGDVHINSAITTNGGNFSSAGANFDNTNGIITTEGGTLTIDHAGHGIISAELNTGAGDISITTETISITAGNDTIITTGDVILQPSTATQSIGIGSDNPNGDYNLSEIEIAAIKEGARSITIGREDGEHIIAINKVTFNDPITIQTPVAGTIRVLGNITCTENVPINLHGCGHTTTLEANITTEGDPIVFTDSVILKGGNISLITTNDTQTGGANISISGTTNSFGSETNALTMDAGTGGAIELTGAVGTTDNISILTITQAASALFSGAVTTSTSVVLTDTVGTVTFAGALTAPTFTTLDQDYNLVFSGGGAITNYCEFLNTGAVTFSGGVPLLFSASFSTAACSGTNIGGAISTTNTQIDLGPTTMTADSTIKSGTAAINIASITGDYVLSLHEDAADTTGTVTVAGAATIKGLITFGGDAVYAVALNGGGEITNPCTFANAGAISLAGGWTFNGVLDTTSGSVTNIAGIVATSNDQIDLGATTMTANATLKSGTAAINIASLAGAYTLSLHEDAASTTGTVTVAGDATITGLTTFGGDADYSVALNGGGTITNDCNFLNTGTVTIGASITFAGGFATTGNASNPSSTSLTGTLTTSSDNVDLGVATLAGATTIAVTNANVTFASTVNNTQTLTVTAGTGTVAFNGVVGGVTPISTLTVTGATIDINESITTLGALVDLNAATDVNIAITKSITTKAADNGGVISGAIDIDSSGTVTIAGNLVTTGAPRNDGTASTGGAVTINTSGGGAIAAAGITTTGGATTHDDAGSDGGLAGVITIAGGTTTLSGNLAAVGGAKTNAGASQGDGGAVTLSNATVLGASMTVDTGATAGNVTFSNTLQSTTTHTETLGITAGTGNVLFSGVVGGSDKVLGAVTITSAGNLTADLAFTAAALTQTAGSGATLFTGAVTTTGKAETAGGVVNIAATVGTIDFDSTITTNGGSTTGIGRAGGNVTLHSTTGTIDVDGTISTIGSAAAADGVGGAGGTVTITTDGTDAITVEAITTTGGAGHTDGNGGVGGEISITSTSSTTTLGANIAAIGGAGGGGAGTQGAGGDVTCVSATVLGGSILIDTGATAGTVTFSNTLNGTAAHTQTLGITAGTGHIVFSGTVGTTALGAVTLTSATNVTGAIFTATSLTQTAGAGTTTFSGTVTTTGKADVAGGVVNIAATVGNISFAAITANGGTPTTSAGENGGDVTLYSAGGTIAVTGTISTIGSNATADGNGGVGGDVVITGAADTVDVVAITTTGGNGNTNGDGGAAGVITLTATDSTLTLAGTITATGGTLAGGGATGAGGATTFVAGTGLIDTADQIITVGSGALTCTSRTIALPTTANRIATSGAITLQPDTNAIGIGIGDAATGAFNLTVAEIGSITNGAASIRIGRDGGTHAIEIKAIIFNDPITIEGDDITVKEAITCTGDASITFIGANG